MTKFAILSDLHLEYKQELKIDEEFFQNSEENNNTILLIPGDISNNIDDIKSLFIKIGNKFKHIVFILGNHSLYNSNSYADVIQSHIELVDDFENVTFLHNNYIMIDNIQIYGGIAFTNIPLFMPITRILKNCNTFRKVAYMTKKFWNSEHLEFMDGLKNKLFKNSEIKKIVMTHFPIVPIGSSENSFCEYMNHTELLNKLEVDVIVSGHVHENILGTVVNEHGTKLYQLAGESHKFKRIEI